MQPFNLTKVKELLQELAASAQKSMFTEENLEQLVKTFQGATVIDLADAVLNEEERREFRADLQDQAKAANRLQQVQGLVKEKLSMEIRKQVLIQNWERLVDVLGSQLAHDRHESVIADINAACARVKAAQITD